MVVGLLEKPQRPMLTGLRANEVKVPLRTSSYTRLYLDESIAVTNSSVGASWICNLIWPLMRNSVQVKKALLLRPTAGTTFLRRSTEWLLKGSETLNRVTDSVTVGNDR